MEQASNNRVLLPDSEKKMDKNQSSSLGDGKGHDGEKRKEHKHKAIKDSSHSEKHREHKSHSESHKMSADSKKHNDSNSKPKENSHNSGSKDIKNKENSSSSKPKDGHNNSITKAKDSVSKSSDSKSSSVKDSGSNTKQSSIVKSGQGDQSKTKVPSTNLNHSAKENNVNRIPKEHGSSSKPKDSGSKPKENSITKLKDSSSSHKPKDNSSSSSQKSKEHSSSGKPKDNNSSKPKESSTSKPKENSSISSSAKPKEGSNSNKHSDSSSKHGANLSSTPRPKENGEKSSGNHQSSSSKPKSSGDKINSSLSSKSKDAIKDKDISKSSSKSGEKSNKMNSSSSSVKVKQEKPEGEKKHHHSKESSDKKEHKKESSSKDKTKDVKLMHPIKQEVNDKSPEKHDNSFSKEDNNHRFSDSYKNISNISIKNEPFSEDDVPLSARKAELIKQEGRKDLMREHKTEKRYREASDSEDEPLSTRIESVKRLKQEQTHSKKRKADDSDDEPISKKSKKTAQNKQTQKLVSSPTKSPTKKKKEEEQEVWKWWEEEKLDEGVKWKSLEHKGPIFAPDYEPLPKSVKFFYDGKHMELSPETEEVATFYSKLLDHDYTTKEAFNKNFFKDWRKVMTANEKASIMDLKLCNFRQMQQYFLQKTEERKAMTKEEKLVIKKQNEELQKEYGFCVIDNHKEKIGNFKIEPPGLFRGRGEHPKMGMLKKRTMPKEVIINCSKGSKIPEPPKGHKWKEVRHDNTVTWLACWTENIQGSNKYIMLNPSSKLKGEKDMQKYEVARKLKNCVNTIRDNYRKDWKSKEMRIRQRAVALYFIDKLALRAGNEKEEGETADTVGCCSLRFEHITLDEDKDGQEFVVNFDFLGKDSIRYVNSVPVEKRVFKNLQLFMENKQAGDDLFDRLNTTTLNKHLSELMDGLTAKVFRTFNASKTLQEQLDKLTNPDDLIPAKMLSYNRANRAVAILCNHQRAVPKTFDKSMENLQAKITAKQDQIKEAKIELKEAKKARDKNLSQKKEKALERLKDQLMKLDLSATDKEENKQIALGTSKLNYLDPRITVAWCKKWEIPIEKVYNRTQRDKFRWAIEMAGPDYVF